MKSAQRQFYAKVEGIDGAWAAQSGGNISAEATRAYDGGARVPDLVAGPAEVEDLELSRPYDAERDQPMLNRLKPLVGQWVTTVSRQPTAADLSVIDVAGDTYPNALLTGVQAPESDAESGDPASVTLTFAAPQVV